MGCKAQISVIRGDVKKEIVVVFGGVDHKIEDTPTYPQLWSNYHFFGTA